MPGGHQWPEHEVSLSHGAGGEPSGEERQSLSFVAKRKRVKNQPVPQRHVASEASREVIEIRRRRLKGNRGDIVCGHEERARTDVTARVDVCPINISNVPPEKEQHVAIRPHMVCPLTNGGAHHIVIGACADAWT